MLHSGHMLAYQFILRVQEEANRRGLSCKLRDETQKWFVRFRNEYKVWQFLLNDHRLPEQNIRHLERNNSLLSKNVPYVFSEDIVKINGGPSDILFEIASEPADIDWQSEDAHHFQLYFEVGDMILQFGVSESKHGNAPKMQIMNVMNTKDPLRSYYFHGYNLRALKRK